MAKAAERRASSWRERIAVAISSLDELFILLLILYVVYEVLLK